MRKTALAIALSLTFLAPAIAGEREDALIVAKTIYTVDFFQQVFRPQVAPLTAQMSAGLKDVAIPAHDKKVLADGLVQDVIGFSITTTQQRIADLYVKEMTAGELSDAAAFARTQTGRSFLSRNNKVALELATMKPQIAMSEIKQVMRRTITRLERRNAFSTPNTAKTLLSAL